jgi:hypothetical protein
VKEAEQGDTVKYFTPELLAKCRSLDPDDAQAAAAKWQARAAAYRRRLRETERRLPAEVRKVIRVLTLQDAFLLTINLAEGRGQTRFFLSFQLADGDGRAGVQLRYDLVKPLKVLLHKPNTAGDRQLFALYDEFDVAADGSFTHSILMTAGVEIRVRFTNLLITRFTRVVAPGLGRAGIKEQLVELAAS